MPKEAANQHFVEILFQNDVKREKGTKEHRRKENRKEENRNKDSRKKEKTKKEWREIFPGFAAFVARI